MPFKSQPQKKNYGSGGGAGGVFGDVYVMLPKEMDIEKVGRFDLRFQLPDLRVSHLFCYFVLKKLFFSFSLNCSCVWLYGRL